MGRVESRSLETCREPPIVARYLAILRERFCMADSHNMTLNRLIVESYASVNRVTNALPAAGERSGRGGQCGDSGSGDTIGRAVIQNLRETLICKKCCT